jgi:iron complex transport system ATP-binding protein
MLEFKKLHAGYDGAEKLHGISARLEPGKLTAVIGPNGCGKSTLLKCAAGLLKTMDGEILLDGRQLSAITEKERARLVSYMPQSRLVPDISVRQLVMHGRYPHLKWGQNPSRGDRAIAEAAIGRVKLDNYAEKTVGQLSGGERQRAYIAMMLAQEAPAMLLDEPTAYLDLASQYELMELLRQLRSGGHSMAVVLHDLALALEYADEILLMQDGRIVEAGAPAGIYDSGRIRQVLSVDVKQTDDGKYVFYPASAGI